MPSLDDLKKRIKSVKSTQKITKAMKMVAAAKLRKAQENAEKGRPYSQKMQNVILNLTKSIKDQENAPKYLDGSPLSFLNVGTGVDISIKELADLVAKYVKYDGEIDWDTTKPDGTPKKQLDIKRLRTLGWKPQISLEEGLKKTINLYQKEYLKRRDI